MLRKKFTSLTLGLAFSVNAFAVSGDQCVDAYFKEIFHDKKTQDAYEMVKSAVDTGKGLSTLLPGPLKWIAIASSLNAVKGEMTLEVFEAAMKHKYAETYDLLHVAQQTSKIISAANGNQAKINEAEDSLYDDETFKKLRRNLGENFKQSEIAQALLADYQSGTNFCNGGGSDQQKAQLQSLDDFASMLSKQLTPKNSQPTQSGGCTLF